MSSRAAFCYILPRCVQSIKPNSWDVVTNLARSIFRGALYHCERKGRPLNHDIVAHYNAKGAPPERCPSICENSGPSWARGWAKWFEPLIHYKDIAICNAFLIYNNTLFVLLAIQTVDLHISLWLFSKSKVSQTCLLSNGYFALKCTACTVDLCY